MQGVVFFSWWNIIIQVMLKGILHSAPFYVATGSGFLIHELSVVIVAFLDQRMYFVLKMRGGPNHD